MNSHPFIFSNHIIAFFIFEGDLPKWHGSQYRWLEKLRLTQREAKINRGACGFLLLEQNSPLLVHGKLQTQTMHVYKGIPSILPCICIVWSHQDIGYYGNLMTLVLGLQKSTSMVRCISTGISDSWFVELLLDKMFKTSINTPDTKQNTQQTKEEGHKQTLVEVMINKNNNKQHK